MKPREPVDDGQQDLFRARLDQIIDMKHPKVVLAQSIDWDWLAEQIGAVYKDGRGYPPLQARLMAGLHILKYMDNLSDEEVCRRFVENPVNTGQAGVDQVSTLSPCQTIQAGEAGKIASFHLLGAGHSGHRAQDRGQPGA